MTCPGTINILTSVCKADLDTVRGAEINERKTRHKAVYFQSLNKLYVMETR